MNPDFTVMAVGDWSPEQGATCMPVEIPEHPLEMEEMVRDARNVVRARKKHMETLCWLLKTRAMAVQADPRSMPHQQDAAQAALNRMSLVRDDSMRVQLNHLCWPRIHTASDMVREEALSKMKHMLQGHSWLMSMEKILEDVERMMDLPETTRLY